MIDVCLCCFLECVKRWEYEVATENLRVHIACVDETTKFLLTGSVHRVASLAAISRREADVRRVLVLISCTLEAVIYTDLFLPA